MNLSYLELSKKDEEAFSDALHEYGMALPFVCQMKDRLGMKISALPSEKLTSLIEQYAADQGMSAIAIDPMQPFSAVVLRLLKQELKHRLDQLKRA